MVRNRGAKSIERLNKGGALICGWRTVSLELYKKQKHQEIILVIALKYVTYI